MHPGNKKVNSVLHPTPSVLVFCRCGLEHQIGFADGEWISQVNCPCGAKLTTTAVATTYVTLPREETDRYEGGRV